MLIIVFFVINYIFWREGIKVLFKSWPKINIFYNSRWGRGLHSNGDERWMQQINRTGNLKNRIKILVINYNQSLIELKNE